MLPETKINSELVGTVVDKNKDPISGVRVSVYSDSKLLFRSAPTGDDGKFRLQVRAGVIEFRKPGYHLGLIESLQDKTQDRKNSVVKLIYQNPQGSTRFAVRMSLLLNYEKLFYYLTEPVDPNQDVINRTKAELRDAYLPLLRRLAKSEAGWTESQRATYERTHRRVSGLYSKR